MAIDFPDSPSTNDTYAVNGRTYTWNGEKWLRTKPELTSVVPTLTISSDLTVDTDTLYVDSTNNLVGIGTTSPAAELDVSAAASPDIRLTSEKDGTWTDGESMGSLSFYSSDTSGSGAGVRGRVATVAADTYGYVSELALSVGGDSGLFEAVRIDHDGKVGIGTTSPSTRLEVRDSLATLTLSSSSTVPTANTELQAIDFYQSDASGGAGVSARIVGSANNSSGAQNIEFHTGQSGLGTVAERMRIDSNGKVGIGTTSPAGNFQVVSQNRAVTVQDSGYNNYAELGYTSSGATDPAFGLLTGYTIIIKTGTSRAGLSDTAIFYAGGNINFPTGTIESDGTYSNTTGSGANMHISSGGYFYRSTSSSKYKTQVETMEDSYADAILGLRPVWYRSLSEHDPDSWGYWGFIAEEVAEVDPRLVNFGVPADYEWQHDEEGQKIAPDVADLTEPEGVQYDRLVPHLVNLAKRQQTQIDALTAQNAALTTRIEALEAN